MFVEVGYGSLHFEVPQSPNNENGLVDSIVLVSPDAVQSPSVPQILERELHIQPVQASIWSQINDQGKFREILMIQIPLEWNWIVITLEFGFNNIIIQFLSLMEALPLPTLISLEEHIMLTDRQGENI